MGSLRVLTHSAYTLVTILDVSTQNILDSVLRQKIQLKWSDMETPHEVEKIGTRFSPLYKFEKFESYWLKVTHNLT